jgi:hypothetical protein
MALPAGATVIVTNAGSADAAFRIQTGAGTAVTTDFTLKAGAAIGLAVGSATHLSAITASGTTTLNIQGGVGGATGYGGGSAGGGGGAVTVASGADATEGVTTDTTCSSTHTLSGCLYAAANNTGTVQGAGTAGTADTHVLTVQGIASGTTLNTQDAADGSTGSTVPSKANLAGAVSGGNIVGVIQADASAKVSVSTNTTTQVVALSSGKKIYVTNFNLHSAGATTTKWVYGTGTNCGTGTTDLTDLYDFAASDGIISGGGLGPVLVVPASNALCITNTASVHVGGSIAYTQF